MPKKWVWQGKLQFNYASILNSSCMAKKFFLDAEIESLAASSRTFLH